VPRI